MGQNAVWGNNKKGRAGLQGTLLLLTLGLASCGGQGSLPPAPEAPAGAAVGTVVEPQQLGQGDNTLSVEPFVSVSNAWGPVERDRSNGEQGAGDGRTLTLNGQTFGRGFGTHAGSSMAFDLGGRCSTFTASVGVDDEVGDRGSVLFQVYADGVKLYDSGKMTGKSATRTLSVSVAGKRELRLVVTDAGDGNQFDHADWVQPTLRGCTAPTTVAAPAPSVSSVTVSPSALALTTGAAGKLTATVVTGGGASSAVTWSSSTPGVATVAADGTVTGVTAGTATIRATSTADASKFGTATVTVSAPAPAPTPGAVVYGGKLVVTRGGTYSGNWESTDTTPAVSIQTSEPVTIENANIRGRGPLIHGYGANLTVRNVRGTSLTPNILGRAAEMAIKIGDARNLRVEGSTFTGGGIYVHNFIGDPAAGQGIRILKNNFVNIDGRKSDGAGGYSGSVIRQMVQFNGVTRIPTAEIAWNQNINEAGRSAGEDLINMYASSGTPDKPILIHDNYLQGSYPANPTEGAHSGGGILLGDGVTGNPETNGYQHAYGNTVISTTNYGMAIIGGWGNRIENNRVISSGRTPDGTRIAAQNVGLYVWDMYGSGAAFGGHVMQNNTSGWTKVSATGTTSQNNWWFPNGSTNGSLTANNAGLGTQTLDSEQAEFVRWQSKLSAAGIVVGAR
ncbi:NPCBM/NEW2 domain-containing protein [Deinococcus budaensis]|uniref:Glycosyl hydrolase n=1 Tax=Deinococcus budaensis TaxID=1665626 RepID=A0A7W8LPQ2_9DEIO|nr:NPCBM/NEW2 domain-containing protein [Deinococcus budaensis]MBB5234006.1 hypothetical protein [Deinococcus budaensis]